MVENSPHYTKVYGLSPEAVFLVMCDPSMNEL
jgi:hypothetical protein